MIYYLTEDQSIFVGTLSRNSERVIAFKAKLVKSFSEARQQKSKVGDIKKYTNVKTQKNIVKKVNGVIFNSEDRDFSKHHQDNYKIHFNTTPSKHRELLVSQGHRVKSFTGRDIARRFKPESACSMAFHDDMVTRGHSLAKLKEMKLREKLEATFKAMIELDVMPIELLIQEKKSRSNLHAHFH